MKSIENQKHMKKNKITSRTKQYIVTVISNMKLIVIEDKKGWTLSIKKYSDKIKPYLKDIININKSNEWKI